MLFLKRKIIEGECKKFNAKYVYEKNLLERCTKFKVTGSATPRAAFGKWV